MNKFKTKTKIMIVLWLVWVCFSVLTNAERQENTINTSAWTVSTTNCYHTDLYLNQDLDDDWLSDFGAYLNTNLMDLKLGNYLKIAQI